MDSFEAVQASGLGASEWSIDEEEEDGGDAVAAAALQPIAGLTQEAMWAQHGIASTDIESNSAVAQLTCCGCDC